MCQLFLYKVWLCTVVMCTCVYVCMYVCVEYHLFLLECIKIWCLHFTTNMILFGVTVYKSSGLDFISGVFRKG